MSLQTIVQEGAFDSTVRNQINAMFAELYALIGAGGSAAAAYPSTTDGVQTLLAAADVDRRVIISVEVTEVFADGTGAQPTFTIGQTGTAAKFAAAAAFTDAADGATFSFSGTLSAGAALIVTAVKAVGDGTGALSMTVIANAV